VLSRRAVMVSGAVLFVLLLAAAGLLVGLNNMLLPVDSGAVDEIIMIEIPPGASTQMIAQLLAEHGLIRSPLAFRLYARWSEQDTRFIAGIHSVSPAMGLKDIVARLTSEDVHRETVWFTIPEGFTVEQIAERLAALGRVDRERIIELSKTPSDSILGHFPYLHEVNNDQIIYLLEGYLFPDTYEIESGTGEEEIIILMLSRFERIFTPEYRRRAAALGMTMHEAATLASLVEKEAIVAHEREKISSVIHNRLKAGMALGIDATTQYATGKIIIEPEDLLSDSPYNTRHPNHQGLTPGPIAAFGEDALRAALYPLETGYYYFTAKYDGTGEHYFSRTLAEHNYYTNLAEQNRRNRG
jgi:UPF0755 protein